MQNEKYWRSKIPLGLALLFVLNIVLVVLVEFFFLYPLPRDLTPELLAQTDPAYENCTILSSERYNSLTCYVVKLENGDRELLATRQHGILHMRCRLLKNQTAPIPAEGRTTVNLKVGIHNVPVTVEGDRITELYFYASNRNLTTRYMVLGAALEALELMVYYLIKRNL